MKRLTSILLVLATILACAVSSGITASAKTTYGRNDCVKLNTSTRKLEPIWNKVVYFQGKRTYTVGAAYIMSTADALNKGISKARQKEILNKVRFDITVIEADGSKTKYYGKTSGFSFKLAKNRTYKAYITSYLYDYKTTRYNLKEAAAFGTYLCYNIYY